MQIAILPHSFCVIPAIFRFASSLFSWGDILPKIQKLLWGDIFPYTLLQIFVSYFSIFVMIHEVKDFSELLFSYFQTPMIQVSSNFLRVDCSVFAFV